MLVEHLEKLIHFSGVVKSGSIRSYALRERLSQSSISKTIQILEKQLETSLFVRDRNGISLTQSGQMLFDLSEQILNAGRATESKIRANGNVQINGHLTLGAYQSIAVYFLPRLFDFLRKVQRQLTLEIETATSDELIRRVRAGRLDFVISVNPPKTKDLHHFELFEDTFSLYRNVNTRKWRDEPIFTVPSAKDWQGQSLRTILKRSKIAGTIVSSGDFEVAKEMVSNGVGLAFLPDRVAEGPAGAGRIVRIRELSGLNQVGRHQIALTCRKHRISDVSIVWLSQQIRILLQSSAKSGIIAP